MKPNIYIIILNWNGLNDTFECLKSLRQVTYPNFEVIVVDNDSTGNDVEVLKEKYGSFVFKFIINESNLGFSGGNNVGIKYAMENGSDYILLLNNDTIVEPDFLSIMIDNSDKNENVGILTPMITYFNDKDKIWSAGGNISRLKASGFTFGHNKNAADYRFNKTCTFGSGCCMLIKREVIEEVGLLDENYFLYLEDTDYCQRTADAGYKLFYVGESRIYHKVFSTTGRSNDLLPLYYSIRNRLYFARKNFSRTYILSFFYLLLVFLFKSIIVNKLDKNMLKIVYLSFKDFLRNRMGKTTLFDS